MKTKAYPKYKPSGVEWLRDVPEHWEVKKLKHVSDTSTGFAFSSDDYTDDGIPLIRIGDIRPDGNIDIENAKKLPIEYLRIYREAIIKKGDILMAMTGATIGKAGQYQFDEPGLLNQRVCKFVPLFIADKYLWFILKSEPYLEHIILTGFGGAQPNISDVQLLDFVTALPPLAEQQAIAAFLDRETGRIDELIAMKKSLLSLLAEQRTALISRAVTKGLNPSVKLKPSCVEWLGDVPEHWKVTKLKYVSDTSTGFAFSSDDYTDEGIPLIRIGDICPDGNIDIESAKKLPVEYLRIYRESIIKKGDFLMAMTGATIGKAGQYQFDEPGLLNQRVCKFVPLLIADKYLWFILKSEPYLEHIILTGFGGAQPNISDVQLLDFVTALPPLSEQRAIADFIDYETTKIDKLSAKVQTAIEQLKEYRTALISAAVTGKIDVREVIDELS